MYPNLPRPSFINGSDPLLSTAMSGDHLLSHHGQTHCHSCRNLTSSSDSSYLSCGCGPFHDSCLQELQYLPQPSPYLPPILRCPRCRESASVVHQDNMPVSQPEPPQHRQQAQEDRMETDSPREATPSYVRTPGTSRPSLYPKASPISAPQRVRKTPSTGLASSPNAPFPVTWPPPEFILPSACGGSPLSARKQPHMSPFSNMTPSAPPIDEVSVIGEGLSAIGTPENTRTRRREGRSTSSLSSSSTSNRRVHNLPSVPNVTPPSPRAAARQAMRQRSNNRDGSRRIQVSNRGESTTYNSRSRSDHSRRDPARGSSRRASHVNVRTSSREAPPRYRPAVEMYDDVIEFTSTGALFAPGAEGTSSEIALNVRINVIRHRSEPRQSRTPRPNHTGLWDSFRRYMSRDTA